MHYLRKVHVEEIFFFFEKNAPVYCIESCNLRFHNLVLKREVKTNKMANVMPISYFIWQNSKALSFPYRI